ncbi:hypothetical protein [Nocardia xishanensis]|uniref:Uncharacterized protein n=1 Tax=Nocardia xishanensis TaxID=238964 RepID=A0ABW7X0G2_9NOCA
MERRWRLSWSTAARVMAGVVAAFVIVLSLLVRHDPTADPDEPAVLLPPISSPSVPSPTSTDG